MKIQWTKPWSVAVLTLALAGCASQHPLGITDAQWEVMSFEEQVEAHQRQVALDAAARYERAERRRDLAELKISLSPDPSVAHLPYRDVRNRPIETADCVLQGDIRVQDGWEKAYPVHFELTSGFEERIFIESWDGRWRQEAFIGFDSMGVQVCPSSLDLNQQTPRCFDIPRTPAWRQGGAIVSGEARETFRGTAQCHLYQPVWQPAKRRAS